MSLRTRFGRFGIIAAVAWVGLLADPATSQDTTRATPPEPAAAAAESAPAAPAKPAPAPAKPAPAAPSNPAPAAAPVAPSEHKALQTPPRDARPAKLTRMCGVCHSDVRVEFDKGIHRSEEIGCISCHGGDPEATTVAAAHRGNGYRGKPRRRDIPSLCATCHSSAARMRPYNLPSDQYTLYQSSHHGMALAKGDEGVAVCTDCHGVHEIRPHDDPQSKVARRNVPATCGRCHHLTADMKRRGHKHDPLAEYKEGAHGRALLVEGNDAAPECADCHGKHSTAPPTLGDVEKVCGQCHTKERGFFAMSAHRGTLEIDGRTDCAACHGNHRTASADVKMFGAVCQKCHDAGDDERRIGARMGAMLNEASSEIERAHALVRKAAAIPIYVEDYDSRLEDARTAYLETVPVTHSLDTTLVETRARRARSIATEVSREVDEKLEGRWWRYVGLGIFWFYLALTGIIIVRARRRVTERDR